MNGAIYLITCLANGAAYIGSAKHIPRRWRTHKRELRDGIHSNSKLQRAWSKYGAAAFRFEVLEMVEGDLLLAEQNWLDSQRPELNIALDARAGMTGRNHTAATKAKISARRISESTRAKLRASMLGNKRCLGAKRSEETKAKMRAAMYARLERKAA